MFAYVKRWIYYINVSYLSLWRVRIHNFHEVPRGCANQIFFFQTILLCPSYILGIANRIGCCFEITVAAMLPSRLSFLLQPSGERLYRCRPDECSQISRLWGVWGYGECSNHFGDEWTSIGHLLVAIPWESPSQHTSSSSCTVFAADTCDLDDDHTLHGGLGMFWWQIDIWYICIEETSHQTCLPFQRMTDEFGDVLTFDLMKVSWSFSTKWCFSEIHPETPALASNGFKFRNVGNQGTHLSVCELLPDLAWHFLGAKRIASWWNMWQAPPCLWGLIAWCQVEIFERRFRMKQQWINR